MPGLTSILRASSGIIQPLTMERFTSSLYLAVSIGIAALATWLFRAITSFGQCCLPFVHSVKAAGIDLRVGGEGEEGCEKEHKTPEHGGILARDYKRRESKWEEPKKLS
jgi:hypothetical protein